MRRTLLITLGVVLAGTVAVAQVSGTPHNLGSAGTTSFQASNQDEVCVFCHTPHQATAANGQDPLWNHTLSAVANYGVYASDTLDATPTDIGGASAGSANVSNLCMSCHDGTIGVGSLYNNPAPVPDNAATLLTGAALVGSDLTNDHPVNFTYDGTLATNDGGLVTPDSSSSVDAAGNVPLFAGTVQCASCHDAHDNTQGAFLVVSNAQSGLCTQCHQK